MPVTLQTVDHACWAEDAQVRHDLERIYADAPQERLPAPLETFIRDHLDAGHVFLCARFNDRLLGAVARCDDGEAWWLSHCCVRKPTRRRGVGSRLMSLVGEEAFRHGRPLRVAASQLPMADQVLLAKLGYRLTRSGDHFELAPRGREGGS